jgi:AraC-like DNA-binding protein
MNGIPCCLQSQEFFGIKSNFYINHQFISKYFPPHRHDFIECEFIVSGEGKEIINGIEYDIKSGSLGVLLPWHIHEIIPDDKNPLEMFKCSFGAELFLDNNSPFFELSDLIFKNTGLQPIAYFESSDYKKVNTFFSELLEEYTEMKPWKETLIKAKISEILIYFDRCRQSTYNFEDSALRSQNKFSIWKVIEYIHSSFDRDITLGEISNKFHYSESYLNKLLRQNIGLNFSDLLQEVRVRNACAMLSYPSISINEIALGVGYKSKEMFYRSFKNVKGISPENYRKLYISPKDGDGKFTIGSVLSSQIIYYLHLHFSENVTLSSVARNFHYNENYFSDVLMQNGINFISLLHEIRIYHACTSLITTDMPINEIGLNVGFDSPETFFRVFKNLRGISPGEYRKRKVPTATLS